MNRDVMERWCEWGILGLVLAILLIGPLALGGVPPFAFLTLQGLTVGVLVLWCVRLWVSRRPQLLWPPVCWAAVAFAAYAVARWLTADIEYVARQEMLQVLVYSFLFIAIINNLHRQQFTQVITFGLLFLAMCLAYYAIYQFVAHSDYVWWLVKPYKDRGSGTYICPNHLGGFLEMLLPLGLAYTLTGRLKPLPRVLVGYASLVLAAGIAVTVSRGSWVSTFIALLCLFGVLLFRRAYRLPAAVFLLALIAAGLSLFVFVPRSHVLQARLKEMKTSRGELNDDQRFAYWRPAIQVWQEHPWLGAGPRHFEYRFRAYRPPDVQVNPDRVHNDYINTLADYGIVGGTLVGAALLLLAWGVGLTWRTVRGADAVLGETRGSNKFAFLVGASCGLMAIFAHSMVDFNMHIPANALLAITLMALLSSHLRFATERFWLTLKLWLRVPLTLLLLAGAVFLGMAGVRSAREAAWLRRAENAPRFSAEQAELLTKAFAAEPNNAATAYAIGETLRIQGNLSGELSQSFTRQAIDWFERSMKLNRWNGSAYIRYGLCLDALGRGADAGPYFEQGEQLDPNSYFVMAYVGLHQVNLGNFAAAKPWLERSLRLKWTDNPIARNYLDIANERLMEAATNDFAARLQAFPR